MARDNDDGLLTRQFAMDELNIDSEAALDQLIADGTVRQVWHSDLSDPDNPRHTRLIVAADVRAVQRDSDPKALAAQVPRLNGGSGRTNANLEGIERL